MLLAASAATRKRRVDVDALDRHLWRRSRATPTEHERARRARRRRGAPARARSDAMARPLPASTLGPIGGGVAFERAIACVGHVAIAR